MADWELLTHAKHLPPALRGALHQRLRARHARRHPVSAPTNVAHQESLSLLDHVALIITEGVGTMWCAIVFALLAVISLPGALATHDPVVIVAWIAQTFLQLVLLPLIMVGQNIQSRHSELRAEADHAVGQETAARVAEIIALLEQSQMEPPTSTVPTAVSPTRRTRSRAPKKGV